MILKSKYKLNNLSGLGNLSNLNLQNLNRT
jgi:hypothetical protein